jgi:hypothetical protein
MWRVAVLVPALPVVMSCSSGGVERVASTISTPSTASTTAPGPPRIVAAGDIALCNSPASDTALLLDDLPGTVAVLGDGGGASGKLEKNYLRCYDPTWGRHRARTRPVPGDNDYEASETASGYFEYFDDLAGEPDKGYYAYDLGDWRVIALNSNCDAIGGCHAGSPQEQWLRFELATDPKPCTLAYWHHARFASGRQGNTLEVAPLWQALYDAGADVVLAAHNHLYERFAPLDAAGRIDQDRGIRSFVVGTGGDGLDPLASAPVPGSEVRNNTTHGVLDVSLESGRFTWRFVPAEGGFFTDEGTAFCH